MFVVAVVVFPFLLLLLLLAMERVERLLRRDQSPREIARIVDSPSVELTGEQVDAIASSGYAPALHGYWRRRRARRSHPIGADRP